MSWTHWIVCGSRGIDAYTPLEINDDGSVNVVLGFCVITDEDDIIERGAMQIIRVDDEYELTNPRTVYEAPGGSAERVAALSEGEAEAPGRTPNKEDR